MAHPTPPFSNLIGNAIKFVPDHGGQIEVGATCKGEKITFTISDNGPGIPAEELPHVFDRYWHSKKSRKAGAGLGLAIARGIVEAHHGQIWVESKEGRGCRFSFSIPTAKSKTGAQLLRKATAAKPDKAA